MLSAVENCPLDLDVHVFDVANIKENENFNNIAPSGRVSTPFLAHPDWGNFSSRQEYYVYSVNLRTQQ